MVLALNLVLHKKELPFFFQLCPLISSRLLSCCKNFWLTVAAFLLAMQSSSNGRRFLLSLGEVHSCVVGTVKYELQAKCLILCSEGSLEHLQLHFFGWVLCLPVVFSWQRVSKMGFILFVPPCKILPGRAGQRSATTLRAGRTSFSRPQWKIPEGKILCELFSNVLFLFRPLQVFFRST